MSLDNATTSARKDGSELDLLGPANPIELVDSPGLKRPVSTTHYSTCLTKLHSLSFTFAFHLHKEQSLLLDTQGSHCLGQHME